MSPGPEGSAPRPPQGPGHGWTRPCHPRRLHRLHLRAAADVGGGLRPDPHRGGGPQAGHVGLSWRRPRCRQASSPSATESGPCSSSARFLAGVAYVLLGWAGGFLSLAAFLVVAGTGCGTQHPLVSAIISRAYPAAGRRAALGTYNFTGDLGKVVAPAAVAAGAAAYGWPASAAAYGIFALCGAVALGALLPGRTASPGEAEPPAAEAGAEGMGHHRPARLRHPLRHRHDRQRRPPLLPHLPALPAGGEGRLDRDDRPGPGAGLRRRGCRQAGLRPRGRARRHTAHGGPHRGRHHGAHRRGHPAAPGHDDGGPPTARRWPSTAPPSVLYGTIGDFVEGDRQARAYGLFYTLGIGAGAVSPVVFGVVSDLWGVATALAAIAGFVVPVLPMCRVLGPRLRGADSERRLVLRPAKAEDSEFAFGVRAAAFGWDEGEERRRHERRFREQEFEVIEWEGEPAGIVALAMSEDCLWLKQICIAPSHQGRGIGGACLRRLLERAEKRGVPVRLQSLKVNPRALAFYERHGFRAPARPTPTTCWSVERDPEMMARLSGLVLLLLGASAQGGSAREHAVLMGEAVLSGGIAWSPDGAWLAVPGSSGIWLHDARSGRLEIHHDAGLARSVAFSPDSGTLAAGIRSEVRMWEVDTGQPRAGWDGQAFRPVRCVLAGWRDPGRRRSGPRDPVVGGGDRAGSRRLSRDMRARSSPSRSQRTAGPWPAAAATTPSGCGIWRPPRREPSFRGIRAGSSPSRSRRTAGPWPAAVGTGPSACGMRRPDSPGPFWKGGGGTGPPAGSGPWRSWMTGRWSAAMTTGSGCGMRRPAGSSPPSPSTDTRAGCRRWRSLPDGRTLASGSRSGGESRSDGRFYTVLPWDLRPRARVEARVTDPGAAGLNIDFSRSISGRRPHYA